MKLKNRIKTDHEFKENILDIFTLMDEGKAKDILYYMDDGIREDILSVLYND